MKRREVIARSRSAVEAVAATVSVVVLEEGWLSDWDRVRASLDQNVVGEVGEAGEAVVLRSRVRWFWV